MIGGTGALLNEAALPDPPPPLASHQRRGLLSQEFRELASLCLSADESVHVDLVPEKTGSNWAPNRHIVNLVPELLRNYQAPNPHNVDFVPEKSRSNWARDRHAVDLVPEESGTPSEMRDGAEDGIKRGVQVFAEVFCQKTQHMAAILLKQRVLAPVPAIGGRIG